MNLMSWSDHFVTGIHAVDTQHRALVDMINAAAPHLAEGGEEARREVGPLLDKLISYAATHFKFEEALMQKVHVAPEYFAQHQNTHHAFVTEVLQMREQYDRQEDLSGSDLLHFLTSWLTFHILSDDKRMGRQVIAIQAGTTPDQAYRQLDAPEGAPQAVYTAALIDLFSLLTQRNRTLTLANEEVRKSKSALESANSQLELRVNERTRDLQESIARLEQTQSQLLQSEKMAAVGQLAAGVAHEINNPIGFVNSNLGSLTLYVQQLFDLLGVYEQVCTALPAEQQSVVAKARNSADIEYLRQDLSDLLNESKEGLARVKRIVNDLRDFSHVDSGVWAPADINQILESALNLGTNELKYKATIEKQLSPLPQVNCIASQLNQVFLNILVNAAHAIHDKGVITLRTGRGDKSVWVEISDTGCGMPEEVRKRIFEPFYTTKPVGKGTGLGLSISWEIIQRHHGTIDVQSAQGSGTTFRISLPLDTI
jgi:two-component system NtrC family sensor kinase